MSSDLPKDQSAPLLDSSFLREESPSQEKILGRLYRMIRMIGTGAQGEVYEVEHVHMGTRFAAKVLHPYVAADIEVLERLRREAVAASRLDHPNIARVVNFDQSEDGTYFVVLELLTGSPLNQAIQRGPLPIRDAAMIASDVSKALSFAHAQGVIHRDVKPANIFLAETARGPVTKVMDFGIAKVSWAEEDIKLTQQGCLIGTPAYMPPEQAGGVAIDHRVDIYAFGAVLFEMLTGRPPFIGRSVFDVLTQHARDPVPDPRRFRSEITPELSRIVLRCMEKEREKRYPSMDVIGTELAHAMKHGLELYTPPRKASVPPPRKDVKVIHQDREREEASKKEAERLFKIAGVVLASAILLSAAIRLLQPLWERDSSPRPEIATPTAPAATTSAPIAASTGEKVSVLFRSDPPGADVFIKGVRIGMTPIAQEIPKSASAFEVTFKQFGYRTESRTVIPNEPKIVDADMKATHTALDSPTDIAEEHPQAVKEDPTGFLTLVTKPRGAEVYCDGKKIGQSPITKAPLPVGSHELLLVGWRGTRRTMSISIERGAVSTYTLELDYQRNRRDRDEDRDEY